MGQHFWQPKQSPHPLSLPLSTPSSSPLHLCSQQLFQLSFYLPLRASPSPSRCPPPLEEGVKKSFLMGFSQIVFTDISEIFRCKENIWTYFSLIGLLMAMVCVTAVASPNTNCRWNQRYGIMEYEKTRNLGPHGTLYLGTQNKRLCCTLTCPKFITVAAQRAVQEKVLSTVW